MHRAVRMGTILSGLDEFFVVDQTPDSLHGSAVIAPPYAYPLLPLLRNRDRRSIEKLFPARVVEDFEVQR
jgi:hypothetical protein